MNKESLCILMICLCFLPASAQKKAHSKVVKLMGSRFDITAVHEDPQAAWDGINAGIAEITRIEKLISSWNPTSQTSEINRNAGIRPVAVDKELYDLIERSIRVSDLTDGAFDITYASMDRVWKFDGSMEQVPSRDQALRAASKINFKKILLNPDDQTIMLQDSGMKIGFGAIGKGYAAQKAKEKMLSIGIQDGIVNASGDLIAWGKQPDGEDWTIGIADPARQGGIISWLKVQEEAVVTSGDYERFVMFEGKRYAHIIDPRTGWPTTGVKSVTIVCPNPELADALATSVFVMGKKKGLHLINQLKGIECLIITDQNEMVASTNLALTPASHTPELTPKNPNPDPKMRIQRNRYLFLAISTIIWFLTMSLMTSCVPVKEYQKMYLNDQEMELSARKLEFYETNFQTYREGASGANGGKVGGGCGCN